MTPTIETETDQPGSVQRFVRGHGVATLYLNDWKEVLPIVVDALITDQPYGTGWIRGGGKKQGQFKRRSETAEWDVFDLAWMAFAPAVLAAFCPTQGVWEMCLRLKTPCVLKYRKSNPAPYGVACEPVVCSVPLLGPWEKEAYNDDNQLHPCQKPVPLMGWLVRELTIEGQTVLDPFMGSGSTGIAALRLGRNFIGVERDARYYKLACERFAHEVDGMLL